MSQDVAYLYILNNVNDVQPYPLTKDLSRKNSPGWVKNGWWQSMTIVS